MDGRSAPATGCDPRHPRRQTLLCSLRDTPRSALSHSHSKASPPFALMTSAMEDEDDEAELNALLDGEERALAVHEAGHTVVASALGADIEHVEIDLDTGNGGSRSRTFDDQIKNLAVCVAGCRAEHLLDAPALRKTKIADFRLMRELLARLPEAERHAARVAGYQLANE